jgi:hypothetical protein
MTFRLPKKDQIDLRRRLIELYLVDTGTREKRCPSALFEHDPVDALARAAAGKLLSSARWLPRRGRVESPGVTAQGSDGVSDGSSVIVLLFSSTQLGGLLIDASSRLASMGHHRFGAAVRQAAFPRSFFARRRACRRASYAPGRPLAGSRRGSRDQAWLRRIGAFPFRGCSRRRWRARRMDPNVKITRRFIGLDALRCNRGAQHR